MMEGGGYRAVWIPNHVWDVDLSSRSPSLGRWGLLFGPRSEVTLIECGGAFKLVRKTGDGPSPSAGQGRDARATSQNTVPQPQGNIPCLLITGFAGKRVIFDLQPGLPASGETWSFGLEAFQNERGSLAPPRH